MAVLNVPQASVARAETTNSAPTSLIRKITIGGKRRKKKPDTRLVVRNALKL